MDIKGQILSSLSSLDSEHAVIGGLMINNDAIDDCTTLQPPMFFYPVHGFLFKAIRSLIADSKPADVVTVAARMDEMGHKDAYGGIAYLAEIQQHTPSAANIRRYIEIVKTHHAERQMLLASDEIASLATERDGRKLADRQAEAMKLLEAISETASEGEHAVTAAEAMLAAIREIDTRMKRADGELGGLPTGLYALDELLDGLRKGELIVIGGRSSMGKSVLAENIARYNLKRGAAVRWQSYEMPAKDMMMRGAAAEMGILIDNIRKAGMSQDEFWRFESFVGMSAEWNMLIDNDQANIDKICARARTHKRKRGLDLLVVDHLHLVPIEGRNEVRELGEITGSLKRLALELDIPVLLVAQLNRGNESGTPRPPRLTDLRGSGAIEQDADVVIMPHRPAEYDPDLHLGEAELHVTKHRNGAKGILQVGWRGDFQRFQNKVDREWNPIRRHAAQQDQDDII